MSHIKKEKCETNRNNNLGGEGFPFHGPALDTDLKWKKW